MHSQRLPNRPGASRNVTPQAVQRSHRSSHHRTRHERWRTGSAPRETRRICQLVLPQRQVMWSSPNHRRPLGACAAPLARLHVGAVWLCSTGTLAHAVGPRGQDQRDRALMPDPGLTGPGTIPRANGPGVASHPILRSRVAAGVRHAPYGHCLVRPGGPGRRRLRARSGKRGLGPFLDQARRARNPPSQLFGRA